mmetsp:Transcript_32767/g.83528  ORF Transcript_32767/g.83528 Transcript_32767/m.83528 type:complete len:201 (-) Transcript_32767:403-1005(-)
MACMLLGVRLAAVPGPREGLPHERCERVPGAGGTGSVRPRDAREHVDERTDDELEHDVMKFAAVLLHSACALQQLPLARRAAVLVHDAIGQQRARAEVALVRDPIVVVIRVLNGVEAAVAVPVGLPCGVEAVVRRGHWAAIGRVDDAVAVAVHHQQAVRCPAADAEAVHFAAGHQDEVSEQRERDDQRGGAGQRPREGGA